jgi:hypothetical protein
MIKINLLPPGQIKRIKMMILYQNVISSGLIIFLMFLSLIVILASFLTLLNSKYFVFEKNINEEQAKVIQTDSIKTIQKRVKDLNKDLSVIKKIQDTKSNLYGVLDKVDEELFSGVKIYTLDINSESKLISVTGYSPFRENLVVIKSALKNNPHYKEVDFPLSDLANPRDINFRFSFIYVL